MIEIKGKYAQAIVHTNDLDNGSKGLITALCDSILAEKSKIRVMPDVHPGKGCAVGMTMTLSERVAPGLVGVDIGCGMEVYKIKAKRLELQKLDKEIHNKIPSAFAVRKTPHRFCDNINLNTLKCVNHIRVDKAKLSIGTLGGGNHFIELDKAENGYYLIIHSGSRHLGVEAENYYHTLAYKHCGDSVPYEFAYLEGDMLDDYINDMRIIQEFARWNRRAIADEIIKTMKFVVEDEFSTIHNYIDTENMILRKGAISAQSGEKIIIPLNMRDGCLICMGKGNPEWNFSAPHGSGRAMTRADVINSFTLSQFKKEMKNIYSSSVSRETLDECPMAYKNSQTIINSLEPTAKVIEKITPVYNFKAGKDGRDR